MAKMMAAMLCLVAAVSADHEWSEKSWKVNKQTGVVTMILDKQTGDAKPSTKSSWYPATVSKAHSDVKSWAMLEHEGETYLVGSKKDMNGKALPSEEQELLVFKVEDQVKSQHQGNQLVMKLSPQKAEKKQSGFFGGFGGGMGGAMPKQGGLAGPISDLEGKDAVWWPWAPFWAPWPAWTWAWPAWPLAPAQPPGKSLERSAETEHLMQLETELAQLLGLEKEGKAGIPAWSGFDPIPGLPHSLYNWVDTPPAIGSLYPAKKAEAAKKAEVPKKVEEAAKKFGVFPVGVWWAGVWYWPK